MKNVRNCGVESEEPRLGRTDGAIFGKVERARLGRKQASCDRGGQKGADPVCVWRLAGHRLEEDIKLAKVVVKFMGQRDTISGSIDISALYQVDNTVIKHVEDSESVRFRR